MRRALTLKRETLAELTDGELGSVAGAAASLGTCLDCWTTILGFRPTDTCPPLPPLPTLAGPPTLDCF